MCDGIPTHRRDINQGNQYIFRGPKAMRKIVQIACSSSVAQDVEGVHETTFFEHLYALCDDGEIFCQYSDGNKERGWKKLPPIPQEVEE